MFYPDFFMAPIPRVLFLGRRQRVQEILSPRIVADGEEWGGDEWPGPLQT